MDKESIRTESLKISEVCSVLGNAKATEILLSVWNQPLSVKDLSDSIEMSLSRTCRLVDMLERVNLVKTEYKSFSGKKGVVRVVTRNLKTLKLGFV